MRYTRWRFLKDSLLEFSFTEMFREMIQFKMQKYIYFFGFRWQKHLLSWTSRVIHPSFLGIPMSFPRMFLLFGPRSPIQSLKSITIWKLQLHPFKFFLSKWIFIHPMQLEFCQPNKFRKTWFFFFRRCFGDVGPFAKKPMEVNNLQAGAKPQVLDHGVGCWHTLSSENVSFESF